MLSVVRQKDTVRVSKYTDCIVFAPTFGKVNPGRSNGIILIFLGFFTSLSSLFFHFNFLFADFQNNQSIS